MHINHIELRDFRNYVNLKLDFDPSVNLIVGDNAQGKTNLLEAIGFLGSGRSFRAQRTAEMVRFGADFADISGEVFSQERQQSLRWVLFHGSRPRQIWRNGAKKKVAADIANQIEIDDYKAELLPDDKVTAVESLLSELNDKEKEDASI